MKSGEFDSSQRTSSTPLSLASRRRGKGIYILPNLFTLGALFGGFYAVVMAMNGRFEHACIGIFWAMVLDSLDGRIARLTHTQTAFGEQMDSLADMVSFGAAPALIAYEWTLRNLGRWGWVAAFVYCACAALRLARFNVNVEVVDRRYFQGLPSPAAAALVVACIWLSRTLDLSPSQMAWPMFSVALYAGLTMVSNLPFYSFKTIPWRQSVPFVVPVAAVLLIAIVNLLDPPSALVSLFVLYGLSGYVVYIYKKLTGRPASVIAISTDEPEERGLHR
jgi:CDP-diacylglycerol--serine O-phosphatidyltransferase